METGGIAIDTPAPLWRILHSISEAVKSMGELAAFELSVGSSHSASFLGAAIQRVLPMFHANRYCYALCHTGIEGSAGLN